MRMKYLIESKGHSNLVLSMKDLLNRMREAPTYAYQDKYGNQLFAVVVTHNDFQSLVLIHEILEAAEEFEEE